MIANMSNGTSPPSPAHYRAAVRVADKYCGREGDTRTVIEPKSQQRDETIMLEQALEHVRRGLGSGVLGKAARAYLNKIEAVLERDYGVHGRIKPDNA